MANNMENDGTPIDLNARIENFSRFVTKMVGSTSPNLHALYGRHLINGKLRTTGRQATGFVRPSFDLSVKLTIRQNPDLDERGVAYAPAELVVFDSDDNEASYFKGGTIMARMMGSGSLLDAEGTPIKDEGAYNAVSFATGTILDALRLPVPEEIFPDFNPKAIPSGLVIPRPSTLAA